MQRKLLAIATAMFLAVEAMELPLLRLAGLTRQGDQHDLAGELAAPLVE
ncbi:MAG: hypothetical protein JSR70_04730, partial [Proteobacteria bacterium]|nr:hypothetical protein [Pseudomonadota bacterium]